MASETRDMRATRSIDLSVPDTQNQAVVEECRRQARLIAADGEGETEIQAWLDAVRDTDGWT